MVLHELQDLPPGLLEHPASELHRVLEGPTLIHLQGKSEEPLFLSVLLHGNEDTGWDALRELLLRYRERSLPRSLSVFIGNVAAARHGLRHLDGQPDLNRIWNGGTDPAHRMAARVVESMAERRVFASIDIHNNTGLNPHYACINRLEHSFLHLANLFSRTVVYFIRPHSVQSMAFSRLCPSTTVECGKPGQSQGIDHALEFIEAALHLDHFPSHSVPPHDYDLFHTVATVKLPGHVSFGFGNADRDIELMPDLDQLNFQELPAGTIFARCGNPQGRLEAWDEEGRDVAARYFECGGGSLYTKIPVMPSMLTTDERVIRQDCLCYLMERLPPI